jgi:lipoprotein-anchoring transpeptidase ErfK/SrfK
MVITGMIFFVSWRSLGWVVVCFFMMPSAHAELWEVRGNLKVFAEATTRSDIIGKLARGSRISGERNRDKPGCKQGWINVEPRGWICGKTRPTEEEVVEYPELLPGKTLPGLYGRVSKAADVLVYETYNDILEGIGAAPERKMDVKLKKRRRVKGVSYWRTSQGDWIERKHIREFSEPVTEGLALNADDTLPKTFTRPTEKGADVLVRNAPDENAEVVDQIAKSTVVQNLLLSADGKFIKLGEARWVARAEVRVAKKASPPADVGADDIWLDIDLAEQTLVVYRGEEPLYAALVSTGIRKRRTPRGTFRIIKKRALTTMYNTETSKDQYSVAAVPWVMYFQKHYAIHGAYWHDRFGAPRSHGCVNLSPKDARKIFSLVHPVVPLGWAGADVTSESEGSLVRIRRGEVSVAKR